MGVYGIAVLGFFSCGISVILILKCGIAVYTVVHHQMKHLEVRQKYSIWG